MSVNTAEIGVVYDALSTKMTSTLNELFNNYTLTDEGRANIIAQSITTIIQVSSQLVQSQPKVDADVTMAGKQASLVEQQELTEAQNTAKLTYEVTYILPAQKAVLEKQDDELQAKITSIGISDSINQAQSSADIALKTAQTSQSSAQASAIAEQSNADAVLKGMQADILVQQKLSEAERTEQIKQAVSEATAKQIYNVANVQKQCELLDKQVLKLDADTLIVLAQESLVQKQTETNEADRQIKLYQLATLLPDEHNKNLKNQELVSAQILQQGAEKLYTEARTVVVTESRIDNLILEDLKSQDTKLGTIGAGGLVPSTNDFNSANALRQVVYDRAKNPTGTLGNITFVAGTTYTKAV